MEKEVRRIFVEKKPEFATEARILYKELEDFLGINGLEEVRIVYCYDIEGITAEEYEKSRNTIFADPPVDYLYDGEFPIPEGYKVIAIEYLPGQNDQRANSAIQSIQLLTHGEKPEVCCAKLILLAGDISEGEYKKIKDYYINPLESREASLDKPDTLKLEVDYPEKVKIIDKFIELDTAALHSLYNKLDLAMSIEDLFFIQDYFKKEKRNPTFTELKVLDTYWSDHCRHTTFLTELVDIEIKDGFFSPVLQGTYEKYLESRKGIYNKERPVTLMDLATIGMKELKKKGLLADLDESEEINACSIKVKVDLDGKKEDWLLMFKNETHNHPTEIEPFGGAATCLGGAIRDPLSGRAYVYQAMRITGSGDPRRPLEETMEGKLSQRQITKEAARGYSSYGNQIGLTTGQVVEIYHENFIAKRMELGAVIAAAPAENVVRKTPEKGDVVILLGGRTGRDGCGGATGSSREQNEEYSVSCGTEVPKGNPPTERMIQRLFRNPVVSKMIKKCNDFGAGGVSVAIGELADSLDINLDAVPTKYPGLDGTELAISESQERMAVVISKDNLEKFLQEALKENLEATLVAEVTDSGRLRIKWQGDTIVDLSRKFLNTNGAKQKAAVTLLSPEGNNYLKKLPERLGDKITDLKNPWLSNLQSLNICSQKGLVEIFDSTIGASTVFLPFGGKNQLTPVDGMVAKIPVLNGDTSTGSIMTFAYDPELFIWSPFHGGVYSLLHSIAKSVALGGNYRNIRLTLQEYFGSPGQDRTKWGKPFSALLGAYLVQSEVGIPSIGGKDSMSGTFKDLDVPPTIVSFAVNLIDVNNAISPEFKEEKSKVVWVRIKQDKYSLPDFADLTEKYSKIHELMKTGKVLAASAVGYGGVAAMISKMSFGNGIGFKFNEEIFNEEIADSQTIDNEELFLPEYGSIIMELKDEAELTDLPEYILLGETISEPIIKIGKDKIKLDEAIQVWEKPLEDVFPTKVDSPEDRREDLGLELNPYSGTGKRETSCKIARPTVFIPIFPGTNCEYDSALKFQEAGAKVDTFVFKNLSSEMIEESIEMIVKKIDDSQIIMFPGGADNFSAAVFRNPAIQEAVMRFLDQRDGLILGTGNGFQALIRLGLLPYGEFREMDAESPALSYNTISRHVSTMVRTKVVSTLSPWLAKVEPGSEFVIPVSHEEGRFIAKEEVLKRLIENGQIATQYVDNNGAPTYDIRYNPNGSVMAIEGITSPDGRVFGKMGQSERIGENVFKNIPGEKDQRIFAAGVEYFK